MGTTADKLNYLSETKELLRQGINNTGAGELLTSSNTFKEYVTILEEHPYYLECLVEGIITDCKVSSVNSIGNSAFRNCSKLTSASFPNVTSIGSSAFKDCSSLTTLYIGTSTNTVCTLANTNAIPSSVATIYVPSSLVNSYKSATNWSSFASKIVAYTG